MLKPNTQARQRITSFSSTSVHLDLLVFGAALLRAWSTVDQLSLLRRCCSDLYDGVIAVKQPDGMSVPVSCMSSERKRLGSGTHAAVSSRVR